MFAMLFGPCGYFLLLAFTGMCFSGTFVAARGAVASPEQLLSMAKLIGTKNPVVARIVCWMGVVVCTAAGVGTVIMLVLDAVLLQ
jgi:hypothetical protein